MKYYFTLHFKRFCRILKQAGFNPYISIFSILALFITFSHFVFVKIKFAEIIYPILGLVLINKLGEKERNNFLKICFQKNKFRQLRLIENIGLALPFTLFLFYKQEFLYASIFFAISILLSFINNVSSFSFSIPTPFYKQPFEFIIGFRKTFIIFIGVYILSVISVRVGNFNLGIFSMIVTFLSCLSFYSKPEPQFYVWVHSNTPAHFLKRKIKTAVLYSLVLSLPIAILLGIFNIDKLHFVVLFELIGVLYVVNSLLAKYAYYPAEININQAFIIAGAVIFPPLLLLTIPFFYSKAKAQLKPILK